MFGGLALKHLAPHTSSAKFRTEEERRPARLGIAISQITVLAAGDEFMPERLLDIQRAMLDAIKSEAERATVDVQGAYLNASLLVPDPGDDALLRCINRTDTARPLQQTHPKTGMHAWTCMHTGEIQCVQEYNDPQKQYRSILCFPLYYKVEDETRALGAVTIDHAQTYAFAGTVNNLKVSLQPYLRMLELVLVLRDRTETPAAPVARPGGRKEGTR